MANMYINAMSDLWNSAGTTYSSIKMNVTNAASAAGSKLLDLQIASVPKFGVDKDGNMVAVGTVTSAGTVSSAAHLPSANDSAALGASGTAWSDLFLASGGVINWLAGDVTITHSSDQLAFSGAVNGYHFDAVVRPAVADGAALGSALTPWSDFYLASGAVVNFGSDVLVTHAADQLIFAGAANGYSFSHAPLPTTADGAALGSAATPWSDLYLASGGVITFVSDNVNITSALNSLTVNGDLRNGNPGTHSTTCATLGTAQTLTAKTITGSTFSGTTISGTTGSFSTSVHGGSVTSGQNFASTSTALVLATSGTGGAIYLRPNGTTSSTEQFVIDTAGNTTTTGTMTCLSYFVSTNTTAILATTGAGNVYLRPNGVGSATGQAYQGSDGGFRSGFLHATGGATSTHSYYNGNGPIGASSWGAVLQANGSANVGALLTSPYSGASSGVSYLSFHQPSIAYWSIYCSGPAITTSGWQVSDAKVKSNIAACDCHDAYSKVKAIAVKSYRKDDGVVSRNHVAYDEMGFVAQELELVIPEAVMDVPIPKMDAEGHPIDSTDSMKVTNDRTLLATLWAAFQHQSEMIESLEAKVVALEGKADG